MSFNNFLFNEKLIILYLLLGFLVICLKTTFDYNNLPNVPTREIAWFTGVNKTKKRLLGMLLRDKRNKEKDGVL